ncbi:MAG: hypothetical protein JXJ04_23745 [Spirochaetales bacterium]|nr:hypothetical protein [Spirochaetales bacterium]
MKAHIISLSRGTVQIGSVVYQPFTNKKLDIPEFEVKEESMEEAKRVLVEYLKISCKSESK